MTLPRIHLFDPDILPAMRRLWDEGLCNPAWAAKTDPEKRKTCRLCPVRQLCEDTGRAGHETGEVWGGWSGSDGHTVTRCRKGHLMSGDNLLIRADGNRRCARCHAEHDRRYNRRRKAARTGEEA